MTWDALPDFEAGSWAIKHLPLCQVRLQDEARFPWLILLPRVAHATELTDLAPADRHRLMDEVAIAAQAVRNLGELLDRPVDKLNIATLGNVTAQLHIHVIGRRRDDPAWPDPVWGFGSPDYYGAGLVPELIAALDGWLA
jgi:diadenosine tetraphosphate (Ap4A) HIT family hydrolase